MKTGDVGDKGSCENEKKTNGEAGIRTLETLAGLLVFETSPIDHSGTSPWNIKLFEIKHLQYFFALKSSLSLTHC